MSTSFIAVAIMMVLLIAFVLVILHSLAGAAGARIRGDMVKLLESYDKVIDAKSQEIRRLQAEGERLRAQQVRPEAPPQVPVRGEPESLSGPASVPAAAQYRPAAFGGSYGAIRDYFRLSEEERTALIREVTEAQEESPTRGADAVRLRLRLSFDTVFRMAQLPGEEQLELLDTSLDDRDWTLLRDFCEERLDAPFEITRFCDWLEERAVLESRELLVRSGEERQPPEDEERDTLPMICEGIQIIVGNRLYDYGINEREIS